MKRGLSFFLALLMALSLIACGQQAETPVQEEQPAQTEQTPTVEPAAEPKTGEFRDEMNPALQKVLTNAGALREPIISNVTELEIIGTTYYVSNDGNDSYNGTTPETAWATLERVNGAALRPGDGVLFRRGDVFRGYLICSPSVTYSAYGAGPMPILTGSPENGAGAEKWTLYGETSDGGKVWLYHRDMRDCGIILFNDGETYAAKATARWNGDKWVAADETPFDVLKELKTDLAFFTPADSLLRETNAAAPLWLGDEPYTDTVGALYLRCDAGNPGEVFNSIEFSESPRGAAHSLVFFCSGVVCNNLHIFCTGDCGFGHADGGEPVIVQNCEVSYCGGTANQIFADGVPELAGDGFNVNIPCQITNCYIHDNKDNGITIECPFGTVHYTVHDISISGCLFENNDGDVQIIWFGDDMESGGMLYRDICIENNYMLNCSGGWSGGYRGFGGACVKVGDYRPPMRSENIVVRNNFMYAPKSRCLIYGGCQGYDPPLFTDNALFVPRDPVPHKIGGVVLWAFPGGSPWANDAVGEWGWYELDDCGSFLNGFLGSGNTVSYDR